MKMAIIRGLILGGSIGIFAYLFGFSDVMSRTALTGSIAGAIAGYTTHKLKERKQNKESHKDDNAFNG